MLLRSVRELCSLFLLLLLCSCGKTTHVLLLPAATHTGVNILACKVNGKVYVVSGGKSRGISFTNLGVAYTAYGDSNMYISSLAEDPSFSLQMGGKFNFATGTYPIATTPYLQGALYNQYMTDSAHGGSITYTYYDGNILAGTFAFDVAAGNDSVIHITEGRFDLKLR